MRGPKSFGTALNTIRSAWPRCEWWLNRPFPPLEWISFLIFICSDHVFRMWK